LQEKLGRPFVIEDRGGGGGNIAAEAVYTADPDGYTLLASQPSPITSNIALYKKLNFDPAALESVVVLSKIPNLLLVRQDFPAKTVAGFIVYAKAHPGGVTFASQGPGTTSHLSGEQFSQLLDADSSRPPSSQPMIDRGVVLSNVDFFLPTGHDQTRLDVHVRHRLAGLSTATLLEMMIGAISGRAT